MKMSNILEEKAALRREIRGLRDMMRPYDILESNRRIVEQAIGFSELQKASTVFCFIGTSREIDTLPLIQHFWDRGIRVAVPLCTAPGVMEACVIKSMDDLAEGAYGILEPKSASAAIHKEEIAFSVVPCISCDTNGNRLGQGGGYYDRYLQNRSYPVAALCRECLMSENIPLDTLDQPVDYVITEDKIYSRI